MYHGQSFEGLLWSIPLISDIADGEGLIDPPFEGSTGPRPRLAWVLRTVQTLMSHQARDFSSRIFASRRLLCRAARWSGEA